MLKLIKKLLGLCNHQYEVFDVADNVDTAAGKRYGRTVITGQIFYMRCNHCGKLKKKVL